MAKSTAYIVTPLGRNLINQNDFSISHCVSDYDVSCLSFDFLPFVSMQMHTCINIKNTFVSLKLVVFIDMLVKYISNLRKINISHKFHHSNMTTANIRDTSF